VEIIEASNQVVSHTNADVEVEMAGRRISAHTTAADGLRSLMGLIIPTSGCPHTAFFRPMARFHLPFSTGPDTLYRATSMFFLSQHVRKSRGLAASLDLSGLGDIYANINIVNMHVAERLRGVCQKDSSLNALTLLDVFAQMLPLQFDQPLEDLVPLFDAYLR
jgi:hypothetical protein